MYGERAKKRRKELGLSGASVAKALNTTRVTISRWEAGISEPDDRKKAALARLLCTSVAYLMGETDNPAPLVDISGTVVVATNDPSREVISKPGHLTFRHGEFLIDIPDTPENKRWFDEFLSRVIMKDISSDEITREPALA